MKRKISYTEPVGYFPKEIRDKYFKSDKPKSDNAKKNSGTKSKGTKK